MTKRPVSTARGGRSCVTCAHPERNAIDKALVAGTAAEEIAKRYGLAARSVRRHAAGHLPATLARAQAAAEVAHAEDLLEQLRDLQRRTLAILGAAEATDDRTIGLRAIREARGNLELLARLLGELDERPVVNILIAPEWLAVRAAMLAALVPYPEARLAVASRLAELEAEHDTG